MNQSVSPARLLRLCQKELRESLRDRRTIITLVLMPLLVYPLLSMILQRLLLSTSTGPDVPAIRIGLEDESLMGPLDAAIRFGKRVLAVRGAETLSIESPDTASPLVAVDESTPQTPVRQILGQTVEIFHIQAEGRQALLSGAIDVLVHGEAAAEFQSRPAAEDAPESSDTDTQSDRAPPRDRASQTDLRRGRLDSANSIQALAQAMAEMPADHYQMEYVPNDRLSETAVAFLRSVFAAINEEMARRAMRVVEVDYHPRMSMSAAPIHLPKNSPTTLASLVPLVLVLMTIAGAVYPAIDLTAGERERGTLEAMIVSPTPKSVLLLSKYVAVVTVALLTAIANLVAMSVTLWASGLGRMVVGPEGLAPLTIIQILCLLILFAMFFSAILLSITSFAKSFKEAQAYLIPVMLVSLAPGVLSLLPQVRLTNLFATVPLANIVLLSRDVLVGAATREAAVIAVACTVLYALAAIAIASRLFGSDASLQGSQGNWHDFLRRPDHSSLYPTLDQMALTMACLFPLYFIASTCLPLLGGTIAYRLVVAGVLSWMLIFGLPTWVAFYRRIQFNATFPLTIGPASRWLRLLPAIVLLAASLWMVGHELMVISQSLGLATFSDEQLKQAQAFADKLPQIPLAIILLTGAVTPALCEEWFFRGFVMSSLKRYGFSLAVVASALLFGLMHVLTSNMLSLERLLPSTFMGLVLAVFAWKTGSLLPGMLLHMLHNGLLLSIGHYKDRLMQWGVGLEENAHLPASWLLGGLLAAAVGGWLLASTGPAVAKLPDAPAI